MNWKHLLWIIPISLLLGGIISVRFIDSMLSLVQVEIMEKAAERVADCVIAWEETPLSDNRTYYGTELCYIVNNSTVCPKRNISKFYGPIVDDGNK